MQQPNYLIMVRHNSFQHCASVAYSRKEAIEKAEIWLNRYCGYYEARRARSKYPGAKPRVMVYALTSIDVGPKPA